MIILDHYDISTGSRRGAGEDVVLLGTWRNPLVSFASAQNKAALNFYSPVDDGTRAEGDATWALASINVCTCFLCALSAARTKTVVFFITIIIIFSLPSFRPLAIANNLILCTVSIPLYFVYTRDHNVKKFSTTRVCWYVVDLKQDFRLQPKDANPASGDTAVLECNPPKGHPEPSVAWHKNGEPMSTDQKKR